MGVAQRRVNLEFRMARVKSLDSQAVARGFVDAILPEVEGTGHRDTVRAAIAASRGRTPICTILRERQDDRREDKVPVVKVGVRPILRLPKTTLVERIGEAAARGERL